MTEHHNTIIIGAGLSGLYTAWKLQQKNIDFILLESRHRTGGRILTAEYNTSRFDLGPAWLWPDFQPRLQQLISYLNIEIFKQFTDGDMLYETASADIQRHGGVSSHSQSYRIAGGAQSLIDALQDKISSTRIKPGTRVNKIQQEGAIIHATHNGKSCQYSTDNIILSLPLRLIKQHINIQPPLPAHITDTWNNIPTWMSGHCKIIFIYESPFWHKQKLSGEVFSHRGPLSEIYDATPHDEEYFALTSFVGQTAEQRTQHGTEQLIESCIIQLCRLFGEEAANILDIKIKDWAQDTNTCTDRDLTTPAHHPQYPEDMPRSFWDKKLILAGTETARQYGGYLEGALESAEEAVELCDGKPGSDTSFL